MVFTSHSVPFPATRDLRSLVAGNGTSWEDKNHFIFLTPVSINKYSWLVGLDTSCTRVSPSHCLVFFHRGQKIRENASHVVHPHGKTNPTVYHMSRSVQSPGRSLVTKLTEILLHRYTRVSPSLCLGFYSKMPKNSGKRIPPVCSKWKEESNGISYVLNRAVSWEEFANKG